MSRVGNLPITVPAGVNVSVDGNVVTVEGSKGKLSQELLPGISLNVDGDTVTIARADDSKMVKAQHGLTRALVSNMITGVNEGFSKKLEVEGVGFKVKQSGKQLTLSLGFSHDITYTAPEDVDVSADKNTITVSGIDKQKVGQVAADIREFKKPEPYKGKGIRYEDEYIIRKSGKAAATGE